MASSSSANTLQSKQYDAFISFRGGDIRQGFLSHLHQSLRENQIKAFVDENLERGKDITSSLLKTIEKSYASIVIFSKNYADSCWCLDELEKILECHEKKHQIVFPVFYHVDPSHVQDLTGSFGDAIRKHIQEFGDSSDKVKSWSRALMEISNLSGWDSSVTKPESKLIREIVNSILEELDQVTQSSNICEDGLVGIGSRVRDVRSLLSLESEDVRVVGIWGMGGIGKTTIADKLFTQICNQFQRRCFVADVREKLENSTKDSLQAEILSGILGREDLKNTGMLNMSNPAVCRRLCQVKVLVVLDDVSDLDQIERLVGSHVSFGPGSRIIITSRDKQLLKNVGANIYEVKRLDHHEALGLFCMHSFKQNPRKKEYLGLSRMAIDYAQGNPLALKVLGSNLYDKGTQEWKDELEKLKTCSDKKVAEILKRSYDGLDEKQQEIFLDIACFFKGHDKNRVMNILDGCGFFAKSGISQLNDKCLVTISRANKLGMHDLLQKLGKDIVSEEKQVGKRSRLWNPKDVYKLLAKDMGTESIEGILLDMTKIRFMDLKCTAFARLWNLRILKFLGNNKLLFPEGLEYFPEELRFLQWDGYPLRCLPLQFCLENLVELHMHGSQITQLWTANQSTLGNLRRIDLRRSENLKSISDLSAVPNLEVLYLQRCTSLVEISSSIEHLSKLTYLDLVRCESLCWLPNCLPSNIKDLQLGGTAIRQLPSSIGCLSHLVKLGSSSKELEFLPSSIGGLTCLQEFTVFGCPKLASLPDSIRNLKSLRKLILSGCLALLELPQTLGDLDSLEELTATQCGIKKLPSSMIRLKQLRDLDCSGCEGLSLPPLTISDLPCLTHVRLRDCHLSEFPDTLCNLKSLEELHLDGNDFEMIPESIKKVKTLTLLNIRDCKRLKYLPGLPESVEYLYARNCMLLESASTSYLLKAMEKRLWLGIVDFGNCINLKPESRRNIMNDALTICQDNYAVLVYIAGSEVPERMRHRNDSGSTLSFTLGSHYLVGLSFSAVVASKHNRHRSLFDIGCTVKFTDDCGHSRDEVFFLYGDGGREMEFEFESHNVFLWRDIIFHFHTEHRFTMASLQFFLVYPTNEATIIKCGVHPVFIMDKRRKGVDESEDEFEFDNMDIDDQPPSKRLKLSQELVSNLILKLSGCCLDDENEEGWARARARAPSPSKERKKCHDLKAALSVLLMTNICLAAASRAKPHPTDAIFAFVTLTACSDLLSFVSSLSLHGFASSL